MVNDYTLPGLPAEELKQVRGTPVKTFIPEGRGKEI
jgi:hypothetical protein